MEEKIEGKKILIPAEYFTRSTGGNNMNIKDQAKIATEMLINELAIEIKKLKQENEKLKECVEFYADENNWHGEEYSTYRNSMDQDMSYTSEYVESNGRKARETLKELEK